MALTKRIIACLDVYHGHVVKGTHFVDLKDAGDPVALGRRYSDEGADELVFLDITAAPEKRTILRDVVREVAAELRIPFTVGGGIRNVEDARDILCSGADKVSINTSAVENQSLVTELSDTFGQQCVVVAIDAKKTFDLNSSRENALARKGEYWFEVYTYGGRRSTGIDALKWAKSASDLGAGEILVTSIDRDGTKNGYDIELTRQISEMVNIPVIASGGAGLPEHFFDAFTTGKADAALAASVFHYDQYSIPIVKRFLASKGVLVRP